ncbi:hypothetical protein AB0L05_41920 [Nonomuraea pusilla]|uniref:hypothetical protein n=1 Tax=Nonomuraea pusilla TaxID=46177 RepID=UPI00332E6644
MALRRTTLQIEVYSLGAIRLYREDLQAIAKAAAELGTLRIQADDFAGDDPDDFADLPEKITELRIAAEKADSRTKIVVELSSKNATVTVTEPDTLASGIRARMQEICHARLRPLRWRPSTIPTSGTTAKKPMAADRWVATGAVGGATATTIMAAAAVREGTQPPSTLASALDSAALRMLPLLSIAIILALVALVLSKSGAILINAYQSDRPTFWQRKRDDIVIAFVSFWLGGLLGWFVNQIS